MTFLQYYTYVTNAISGFRQPESSYFTTETATPDDGEVYCIVSYKNPSQAICYVYYFLTICFRIFTKILKFMFLKWTVDGSVTCF